MKGAALPNHQLGPFWARKFMRHIAAQRTSKALSPPAAPTDLTLTLSASSINTRRIARAGLPDANHPERHCARQPL